MSLGSTATSVAPITGGDHLLADGGYFYKAINPTPATGIVGPVSITFDTTKALLAIANIHASKSIYLRFLRLHVATVGTTGSIVQFTGALSPSVNRISTIPAGGTLTPQNTNSGAANETHAQIGFGALTLSTADANARNIMHAKYKSAIEVVDDTYQFSWGSAGHLEDPCSLINNTTTLSHVTYAFEPVCIAPGATFSLHQWRASITIGITFDVELGYILK